MNPNHYRRPPQIPPDSRTGFGFVVAMVATITICAAIVSCGLSP